MMRTVTFPPSDAESGTHCPLTLAGMRGHKEDDPELNASAQREVPCVIKGKLISKSSDYNRRFILSLY